MNIQVAGGHRQTMKLCSAFDRTSCSPVMHDQIAEQAFFEGMTEQQIQILADSAMKIEFEPGEWIYRQGDIANRFYIILEGEVLLESDVMKHEVSPIRKLGPGETLGWAWLFPPFYMHFSAQAVGRVKAIFFYGTRLRRQCESNHDLGYKLMLRVAEIVVQNLHATQERLLERGTHKVAQSFPIHSSDLNVLSAHVESNERTVSDELIQTTE